MGHYTEIVLMVVSGNDIEAERLNENGVLRPWGRLTDECLKVPASALLCETDCALTPVVEPYIQCKIACGSFKGLLIPEYLHYLRELPWEEPKGVSVCIKDEQEEQFHFFRFPFHKHHYGEVMD